MHVTNSLKVFAVLIFSTLSGGIKQGDDFIEKFRKDVPGVTMYSDHADD